MQVRVGAYELIRPLGVGGMAETFLAIRMRTVGPARRVCLKRILVGHASDPSFLELFSDEAQLLAHMHHPCIVQIYDFGEADGSLYMALELVEGVDLERIQSALVHRRERLQPPVAVFLVSKLLAALDYAHTLAVQGQPLHVVHRDISPSNILISRRGEVKLTDFGIAKARGRKHRTQSGFTKGKLAYMSPEQVRAHELDARSDLFAVGVVLHELLTGVHPFEAPTEVDLLGKILAGQRPRLRSLLPRAPARLVELIDALLATDPAQRPESAAAALRLLPPTERPIDCQQALAKLVQQLEPPGLFAQAAEAEAAAQARAGAQVEVPRMFAAASPRAALHEAPTRAYQHASPLAHEAPTRADLRASDLPLPELPGPRPNHAPTLQGHGSPLLRHEVPLLRKDIPVGVPAVVGTPPPLAQPAQVPGSGFYATGPSPEQAMPEAAPPPPPLPQPPSRPRRPPPPPPEALRMERSSAAVRARAAQVVRPQQLELGTFALSERPRRRPRGVRRLVHAVFFHRRFVATVALGMTLLLLSWMLSELLLPTDEPPLAGPAAPEERANPVALEQERQSGAVRPGAARASSTASPASARSGGAGAEAVGAARAGASSTPAGAMRPGAGATRAGGAATGATRAGGTATGAARPAGAGTGAARPGTGTSPTAANAARTSATANRAVVSGVGTARPSAGAAAGKAAASKPGTARPPTANAAADVRAASKLESSTTPASRKRSEPVRRPALATPPKTTAKPKPAAARTRAPAARDDRR